MCVCEPQELEPTTGFNAAQQNVIYLKAEEEEEKEEEEKKKLKTKKKKGKKKNALASSSYLEPLPFGRKRYRCVVPLLHSLAVVSQTFFFFSAQYMVL